MDKAYLNRLLDQRAEIEKQIAEAERLKDINITKKEQKQYSLLEDAIWDAGTIKVMVAADVHIDRDGEIDDVETDDIWNDIKLSAKHLKPLKDAQKAFNAFKTYLAKKYDISEDDVEAILEQ